MTPLLLWLFLLVLGAIAGFFGLAEWRTVVTAAVSSGIFAALLALFGEDA